MPLDIRRLRQDPTFYDGLERSIVLRQRQQQRRRQERRHKGNGVLAADGDHDDNGCDVDALDKLKALDAGARTTLQKLNLFRCEAGRKRGKGKDHEEEEEERTFGDSKQRLKELERDHREAQRALEEILKSLPNLVDEDLARAVSEEVGGDGVEGLGGARRNSPTPASTDSAEEFVDVFFCIGGYEELNGGATTVPVLTGLGMDLVRAVERTALDFATTASFSPSPLSSVFRSSSSSSSGNGCRTWHVPAFLPHGSGLHNNPSWKHLLLSLYGPPIFDKALPQFHALVCRGNGGSDCISTMAKTSAAKVSDATTDRVKKKSWCDRMDPSMKTEIQLLFVTGSSLLTDSRPLQIKSMERIRDFYRELLPGCCELSIRALPPDQLDDPSQASCLVLEVTTTTPSSPVRRLAWLSNYLDYESNSIRHGHTKSGIHVLHGRLCAVEECLDLLLLLLLLQCSGRSGAGVEEKAEKTGGQQKNCLKLRGLLLEGMSHHSTVLIPYQRMVSRGKNGRRVVIPLVHQPKSQHPGRGGDGEGSKRRTAEAVKELGLSEPTPDDIRDEALSCPFDILPFRFR